jgi:uncharacterized membrane protein YgaE (UPF0421/DUF939 family)
MSKEKTIIPTIGFRTIKTCIACFITAVIYMYLFDARNACFALIGAAYATGSHYHEGFKHGFNRTVGTAIGGVVALLFYYLYHVNPLGILPEIYMVVGLLLTIYGNILVGSTNAVQPAIVAYFVILYTQPELTYVTYTIARIIDTGVGALFGLLLNLVLPSKLDKIRGIKIQDTLKEWIKSNQKPRTELDDLKEAKN